MPLRLFGETLGCRRRQRLRLSSGTQIEPLAERRTGMVSSRCCELTSTSTSSSSSSETSAETFVPSGAAMFGSACELSTLMRASTSNPHFAIRLAIELDNGFDFAGICNDLEAQFLCCLAPSALALQ